MHEDDVRAVAAVQITAQLGEAGGNASLAARRVFSLAERCLRELGFSDAEIAEMLSLIGTTSLDSRCRSSSRLGRGHDCLGSRPAASCIFAATTARRGLAAVDSARIATCRSVIFDRERHFAQHTDFHRGNL